MPRRLSGTDTQGGPGFEFGLASIQASQDGLPDIDGPHGRCSQEVSAAELEAFSSP